MIISNKIKFGLILLLAAVASLTWVGYIDVPITNEDYLILSWMEPDNLSETLHNFHQREVGGPYWRPVTWTADSMTKYLFGYNAIPYHITNILIYTIICILFFLFLRQIGFDFQRAWLGAFIFSVLPAHELSVAWIAGRTDTLMAMFLLAASVFYLKERRNYFSLIVSLIFLILAYLSKEPAFAAAVLPFLYFYVRQDKFNIKETLTAMAVSFITVFLILIFRSIVIGGSPFESDNFANITYTDIITNFVVYIFAGFLRADTIDYLYHFFTKDVIGLIALIILIIVLIIIFVHSYIKAAHSNRKLTVFGLVWFVIFIIPATARFGQWYAFTSSMGLVIVFISLLRIDTGKLKGVIVAGVIIVAGLLSSIYMMSRSYLWHNAANISNEAFKSLTYPLNSRDTLVLLGVPDKVNMINCAKIGCEQAVWKRYESKTIEVSSPLRSEIYDNSKFNITKLNDSVVIINLINGRFLPVRERSRSVLTSEKFNYADGFQKFRIVTDKIDKYIVSKAEITIKEKTLRNRIFAFNGRKFIHLE